MNHRMTMPRQQESHPLQDRRSLKRRRGIAPWMFLLFLLLLAGGVFSFLYIEAENDLNAWLAGTHSRQEPTIIYAAPRTIRVGQRLSRDQLLEHLSRAGYTDASKTEDPLRGRYRGGRHRIDILPGASATLDGQRLFFPVRVNFTADDRTIERLTDLETRQDVASAVLEPEQISSLAAARGALPQQERGIRWKIEYKQLPPHLVHAVVAAEDKRFFEHTGVDYLGILRALWNDLITRETVLQGGSTITQQLVKNILVGRQRTLRRKIREAFLALALERKFTKEQIFTYYANVIYLGRRGGFSIYGFGAAAREYFDKDVSALTLPEAAFLAGIINRPGYYIASVPRQEIIERGVKRRNVVLDLMVEAGFLTPAEAERAKRAPLTFQFRSRRGGVEVSAPYFLDYVQELLSEVMPASDVSLGYRVYTTIDMGLQRAATAAVTDALARLDQQLARSRQRIPPGTVQAALVALDAQSGEILALVGGRNYLESQFNRATDGRRQPGSAIKPFVYTAALALGSHEGEPITLAHLYRDEPREFEGGYAPKNFGDSYLGRPVSVREALVRSLNVITVALAQETGYATVAETIQKCGLGRPPAQGATALGASEATPLDLASAYTVFVNQGRRAVPLAIRRISEASGRLVREWKEQQIEAVPPEAAYLVLSAMQDVIAQPYGTGHLAASLGLPAVAGKTGTSQRSDAWFVGLTPRLVCVTWVGFDDNRRLEMTGSHAALPIWLAFMRQVATLRPDLVSGSFVRPDHVVERVIDPTTGRRATDHCPVTQIELFIEGREITDACPDHPGAVIEEIPTVVPSPSVSPSGSAADLLSPVEPAVRRTRQIPPLSSRPGPWSIEGEIAFPVGEKYPRLRGRVRFLPSRTARSSSVRRFPDAGRFWKVFPESRYRECDEC
jgi:penicillin-binding protein 1B